MVYNPDKIEKDYIGQPGGCWKCGTQLTLKDKEVKCDKCDTLVRWWCNSCSEPFDIVDKESNKKLDVCKLCGYFKCPHCTICSWNCRRYEWEKEIIKMLRPEITQAIFQNLPEKVREIVNYIEHEKINIDRKNCPERNVPISYAKNRIKSLLVKFEGFRVKNEDDRNAFMKRFEEITDIDIGNSVTVTETREKGSYGQEYRDAFNLAVCFGKFKIVKKKRLNSDKTYDAFVRCEESRCRFLDVEGLLITYCENCKTQFPKGTIYCDKCSLYSKGINKGQQRKLKEKLTNKDTCQCYRGLFNKKEW